LSGRPPPLDKNSAAASGQPEDDLALQRAAANKLQNILDSTDFATIFLDTELNIRFFTPDAGSLIGIFASDIGRSLAHLRSQVEDEALLADAGSVLRNLAPVEREIRTRDGAWFARRITPCHTPDNRAEGVVITYADITKGKHALETLTNAKQQAELATATKSRFLAAASHDLRQPLQSLALLQELLSKAVEGQEARQLVARLGEILGAIAGILTSLRDINQIESDIAGTGEIPIVEDDPEVHELPAAQPPRVRTPLLALAEAASTTNRPVIHVVDDDGFIREGLRNIFEEKGWAVEVYPTAEAFFEVYHPVREECLLIDAYLPGMNGLELMQRLRDEGHRLPSIMITGNGDVPLAVQAMKAGASDFLEKPIGQVELIACVRRVLDQARDATKLSSWRKAARDQMAKLTVRERQVMAMVLAGRHNKNIAADLGISQRTVENHRASIMKRMGAKSLPALARLALSAGAEDDFDQAGPATTDARQTAE